MRSAAYFVIAVLGVTSVAYAGWHLWFPEGETGSLVLHGNVDLRQVDLPFNAQQRVAAVYVEEGDRVNAGQLVARLETSRLEAAANEAWARAEAQRRVVERLDNGTRPEEIAQARARVASAEADLASARGENERFKGMTGTLVASVKEMENARFNYESAVARLGLQKHALDQAIAGPRAEERAEARATLAALEAQVTLRQRELADAELRSPVTGVVRNRILEPGEMSAPGAAAVTIAVTDPKWVRAYVTEPELGKVRPGAAASVSVDAFPDREFGAWVGFVSPVAEFTPKNVETPELRTSLMYEVRVFFNDPRDLLRLGMPASVRLRPDRSGTSTTRPSL